MTHQFPPPIAMLALGLLVGCHHQRPDLLMGKPTTAPTSTTSGPVVPGPVTSAETQIILPKVRALAPPTGTMTWSARPVLRVTPGTEAIEICKTRACAEAQRVAVGPDGQATPPSDLARGVWFWRTAAQHGTAAGPAWAFFVRPAAGHSSRVHGFDANGDGRADIAMGPGILFGAAAGVATSTPVGRAHDELSPAGDIDGDGFDDAVLGDHVVRGGASGIRAEGEWFLCPQMRCGVPVGDLDGDGYADLLLDGSLQLGSPGGLRELAAPLLAHANAVRPAGDLDGDGIADIVVLGEHHTISVVRGGKAGVTAGAEMALTAPEGSEVGVEIADIDGDGIPDIVTSVNEPLPEPSQAHRLTITVRSTLPGGDITHGTERRVTSAGDEAVSMQVADVDGDGFDDIIVFSSQHFGGTGRVIRGSAASSKLRPGPAALRLEMALGLEEIMSVGDFNGDGRDDIVLKTQQVAGFIEVFNIHIGSKGGISPNLFASYNLNNDDQLAARRIPRRPKGDD